MSFRLEDLRLRPARWLFLVGGVLISQVAFRGSVAAQGYLHLSVGWLALALAFWLACGSPRTGRALHVFLVLLGIGEAVFALLELYGRVPALDRHPEILRHLAIGTLINPNHFAGLVNICLALGVGLLAIPAAALAGGWLRRTAGVFSGAAIAAGLGLMAWALYRAESRGGTIALAGALLWIALLAVLRGRGVRQIGSLRGSWSAAALALLAALILIAVGVAVAQSGILSLQNRLEVYRDTLGLIADHPLLGTGPGTYRWAFRPYQTVNIADLYTHAHNDYLETAADWGVPLALLFWIFVARRLLGGARVFLRSDSPWDRAVSLGCSGAIAAILVHSLVDFNLYIPINLVLFSIVVGLSWSREPIESARAERRLGAERGRGARIVARLLALLLLVGAGWAVSRRLAAIEVANQGTSVADLGSALALDPWSSDLHFRLGLLYRDDLTAQDLQRSREHLERAAALNPLSWRYRRELAELYELQGLVEPAEETYRQALALNPRAATYHWRLANFLLRRGRFEEALPSFRATVIANPKLGSAAFDVLALAGATAEQLDRAWPEGRRARLRLFALLPRRWDRFEGRVSSAQLLQLWEPLRASQEPPTPAEAGPLLDLLLRLQSFDEARRTWVELAAARELRDEDFAAGRNALWNGQFELPLEQGLLAWTSQVSPGAELAAVEEEGLEGSMAVRIDLSGDPNLNSHWRLGQLAIVNPGGTYRLSLAVRATGGWDEQTETSLTVRVRPTRRELLAVGELPASRGWAERRFEFDVPEEVFLIELDLRGRRAPASTVAADATLWLDSAVLERAQGSG